MASIRAIEDLIRRMIGHAGIPLDIVGNGRLIFVDPANGNDNNNGRTPYNALASLGAAHTLATAGKNDTVFLIGDGSTAATNRLTDTLTWSKNATHLIGVTAPVPIAARARISHASTAPTTVFTPMVQVTASGCRFQNLSIFEGFDDAANECVTWEDQGARNYYEKVHIGAMGSDGDTADDADSAGLLLTGGGERMFKHCAIGLDTIPRGAANASVRFRSQAARDLFEDCLFPMSADQTSPLFIDANAANSLNRWAMFKRCDFLAGLNYAGVATPAVVAVGHANQNGTILLNACTAHNTTDWAATGALIKLAQCVTSNGDTGGEFVNSAAT